MLELSVTEKGITVQICYDQGEDLIFLSQSVLHPEYLCRYADRI